MRSTEQLIFPLTRCNDHTAIDDRTCAVHIDVAGVQVSRPRGRVIRQSNRQKTSSLRRKTRKRNEQTIDRQNVLCQRVLTFGAEKQTACQTTAARFDDGTRQKRTRETNSKFKLWDGPVEQSHSGQTWSTVSAWLSLWHCSTHEVFYGNTVRAAHDEMVFSPCICVYVPVRRTDQLRIRLFRQRVVIYRSASKVSGRGGELQRRGPGGGRAYAAAAYPSDGCDDDDDGRLSREDAAAVAAKTRAVGGGRSRGRRLSIIIVIVVLIVITSSPLSSSWSRGRRRRVIII